MVLGVTIIFTGKYNIGYGRSRHRRLAALVEDTTPLLGTWRYLLAVIVALSHTDWRLMGLNPGVVAVIGFYLTSGYVMAGVLSKRYTAIADAPRFYLDRGLRLMPLYSVMLILTLAWLGISGASPHFLEGKLDWKSLFNNITIIPLNFYRFNGSDRFTLIPPAWSLGAEVQFYLLLPFIMRIRTLATVISVTIYVCAATGVIDTELYGFRLIPGVLWFFLLGSWLFEAHRPPSGRTRWIGRAVFAAWLIIPLLWAGLWASGKLDLPYNRETLIGVFVGLPALHLLARLPRQRWDENLGDISYGLFLSHFLLLWAVFQTSVRGIWQSLAFVVLGSLFAWTMHRLVERPALELRRHLRAA